MHVPNYTCAQPYICSTIHLINHTYAQLYMCQTHVPNHTCAQPCMGPTIHVPDHTCVYCLTIHVPNHACAQPCMCPPNRACAIMPNQSFALWNMCLTHIHAWKLSLDNEWTVKKAVSIELSFYFVKLSICCINLLGVEKSLSNFTVNPVWNLSCLTF